MASGPKQMRFESTVDLEDIESRLQSGIDSDMRMRLGSALKDFLLHASPTPSRIADTVQPLRIRNCNATDTFGVPFSNASCSIERSTMRVLFVDIFDIGMRLIVNFLKNKQPPSTRHEKIILWKLLRFVEVEEMKTFENIDTLTETGLVTLLANHLFGRLSTTEDFIMDRSCHGKGSKKRCPCGNEDCMLTGSYGDTSIGNGKVWHGSVDIIIGNDICVKTIVENPDGSPGGKSPVEVKKLKSPSVSKLEQTIAETIVFSFLQKKRHPENKHFLTPCIGVGGNEMVIMFYDAMHDVLLESSPIPLMEYLKDGDTKFTLHAVLVSWFVVNYKFLCNGLTERMKSLLPKANFFDQAKLKIDMYENDLKFQNVGRSSSSENAITGEGLTIWKSQTATGLFEDLCGILSEPNE